MKQVFKQGDKVGLYLCDDETNLYSWCDHFTYSKPATGGVGHYVINDYGGAETSMMSENLIRHVPRYADYPGGDKQHALDVATLTKAGLLADKATAGDWEDGSSNDGIHIHGNIDGSIVVYRRYNDSCGEFCEDVEAEVVTIDYDNTILYKTSADRELILNAADIARAAGRFVSWALKRTGE